MAGISFAGVYLAITRVTNHSWCMGVLWMVDRKRLFDVVNPQPPLLPFVSQNQVIESIHHAGKLRRREINSEVAPILKPHGLPLPRVVRHVPVTQHPAPGFLRPAIIPCCGGGAGVPKDSAYGYHVGALVQQITRQRPPQIVPA